MKPGEVQNLTTYSITTTSVSLTWQPPEGNYLAYLVQILGNSTFGRNVTSEFTTVDGLIPGNCYMFQVTVLVGDKKGESANKTICTRPASVILQDISKVSNSSIYVSWFLSEGNRSAYLVKVEGDPSQSFIVMSESVIITNLTSRNQYTVKITALAGENDLRGISTDISVLLLQNISATYISNTSVLLSWEPIIDLNISYKISVYGSPTSYLTLTNATLFIDDLTPGNFYTIQISAFKENMIIYGYGGDISLYTRPNAVTNTQYGNVSTNSVELRWLQPVGNFSFYRIEVTGDSKWQNLTTNSESVTIDGLKPGNQYTFRIVPITGPDVQGDASEITVFTKPGNVQNLITYSTGTTSVSLSWQPPEGNWWSYLIQILEISNFSRNVVLNYATVDGLTPGNYYTLIVTALVGDRGIKGESANTSTYTKPESVQNLATYNISTTSVSLSWQPPEGNHSFYLIHILENSTFNRMVTLNATTIDGFTPGNYYTFIITALVGDSDIKGESINTSTYTKPGVVKNLTTYSITTSSVSLSWVPPDGNASSFLIEVLGNSNLSKNVVCNFTTIDGLTPGNLYIFILSAAVGESNVRGDSVYTSTYTKPERVQSLAMYNISTTSVSLSWQPPEGNHSSYLIQILENSTFNRMVTLNATTIDGLTPGNYYTFIITVFVKDSGINGESTNTSTYTKPGEVQNLTTYNISTTSVSLSWQPPEGNCWYYLIQILENSTFSKTITLNDTTIDGLTPGNYYTFIVTAFVGDSGMNGESANTSTYTIPGEVKNLTTYNVTTNSVSLSWETPEGNTSSFLIQILGNVNLSKNVASSFTTIYGLTPGNFYTFIVSVLVGERNVRGESINTTTYTKPGEVQNLTTYKISTTSVSLSWQPPEGNCWYYLIQILENSTFSKKITLNDTTIDGLTPGNYYTFIVTAFVGDSGMNGESANTSTYTKPGEVMNLTTYNITTNSVSLSWETPEGNTSSFLIQILGNSNLSKNMTSNFTTIDGLTPGNFYTFIVSALVGESNVRGESANTSTYTKPGEVQNLTTYNISTTSVSLSWQPPEGICWYYLIQILENSTFSRTITLNDTTIDGLIPGNYYIFIVTAFVGDSGIHGESANTSTYTIPGEVKNLTTYNVTINSVSLSWETPEGNTSSFLIQILGNVILSKNVASSFTTIYGLTPGNFYTFIVSALVGESNVRGESANTTTYTKPGEVQNLTTYNTGTTSVFLSWQPPEGNCWYYLIQILENSTFSKTITLNDTTIDGLTPGNYYTFIVTAFVGDSGMNGESANTSTYTKPGEVMNLTTYNITTNSVSLSWETPEGNTSSFLIQILGNSNLSKNMTSNFTTIDGLTPGNFYTFIVSALVGESNVRGESANTSTYTKPGEVQNLTTYNISTTSVSLSWQPPEGICWYYLIQILKNSTFSRTITLNDTTIDGLIPGNYYIFIVTAFVGDSGIHGESANTSTYTIPGEVKNLTTYNVTINSVSLSWETPEGNTSSFLIQILGNVNLSKNVASSFTTIYGLTPGNFYTFIVSALVGKSNVRGESANTTTYTKPGEVQNLTTYNTGTTSVSLSWQPPEGNCWYYLIQILENSTFSKRITLNDTTIDGLIPGNYYTFIVTAFVGDSGMNGESANTSTYTKPGEVMNLTTYNITTNSVSLSWETPEGNTSSFLIQILGNSNLSKNMASNFTTIDGLTPGNFYTFIVSALVGESNVRGESANTSTYTKPGEVQNLTTYNISTTSVSLSWQPPEGICWYYLIQILENSTFSRTITLNDTTIDGLTPGNYYIFIVTAFVGDSGIHGESANTSTYIIPRAVMNLTMYNVTTNSVSLSWETPEGNTSSFLIQILGNVNLSKNVASSFTTIYGLTPGNFYTFIVSALVGESNVRGESANTTTYTKPGEVQNLTTYKISTTSVSLSWQPPEGNCWYYLIQILENSTFSRTITLNGTTIDGLTPGNYYTFIVTAFAGDIGIHGESANTSTYTKPGEVQNLTTYSITTTSVSLIWQPPEGNYLTYLVQILGNSTFGRNVTSEFTTVDGLIPGNCYMFQVTVLVGDIKGESANKAICTRPASVILKDVSKVSNSSIYVSWLLSEGNRSAYLVEVVGDPSQSFILMSESVIITNLTSRNQYTVKLTALAGENDLRGISTDISVLLLHNISATYISNTSVLLSWEPIIDLNISYKISVYGSPTSYLTLTNATLFIDDLTPGNFYTIQISAFKENMIIYGYGGDISLYTRPNAVTNTQYGNVSTNSVELRWLQPVGNFSFYRIEVTGDSKWQNLTTNSESVTIDGLKPGNQYTFRIVPITGPDVQGDASEITVFTKPGNVQNLITYSTGTTSVSLSWQPPEGNWWSYLIQILEISNFSRNVVLNYATVDGLTPGNYYTLIVTALVGDRGIKGESANTSTYTKPESVQNLATYNISTTSVSLSWQPPEGNHSFYLIHILENSTFNRTVTLNATTIDGLTPGNYYTFIITVFLKDSGINGESANTSTYTKPGEVQNLTTCNISTTSVSLSWQPPEGNCWYYLIQILENSTFSKMVTLTDTTIDGLTPGNYYTFIVVAFVGDSGMNGESANTSTYTKPGEVMNLTTYNVTINSVSLRWETPKGNTSSFLIQVLGNSNFSKNVGSNFTTIDGLIPGNYYIFIVSAAVGESNVKGESANTFTYTIPSAIDILIIENVTTNSVSLSWAIPLGNISSYIIQVLGTPSKELIVDTNSYIVDQLVPGNYYTFAVFATAGNMNGSKAEHSTFTVPSVIANLIKDNVTTNSVYLCWSTPLGNISSYIIQVLGTQSKELIVNTNCSLVDQLIPGNYYTFMVFARAGNMNGTKTLNSTFTVPSVIESLIIENVTTISVSLSWAIPLGNISSYIIQVLGTPSKELIVNTNSSLVDQLIPGNYYTFMVFATAGNMNGTKTLNSTFIVPSVIESLIIDNVTTSTVSLSWDTPLGNVSSYIIQVLGTPSKELMVNTNSSLVDQLIPGNYYTFMVFATAGNMNGTKTQIFTYTVPSVIESLIIDNVTTSTVSLSWDTPLGNVSSYIIQVLGTPSKELMVNTNSSLVDPLIPGNYYTFMVFAIAGNMNGTKTLIFTNTVPSVITSLIIDNITTSSVSLSWDTPLGNVSSYIIHVLGTPSKKLMVNTNSSLVDQLIPGNYYTFMVFATAGNMNGTKTRNSTFSVPSVIASLFIDNITTSSVSLNWPTPLGNISSYIIQVLGTPSQELIVNTNSFLVDQLIPGNYYTFLIFATAGNMNGTKTLNSTFTVPSAIESLVIDNITTSSVSLIWATPLGNISSYIIQVLGTPSQELIVNTNSSLVDQLIPGNYYTFMFFATAGSMNGTKTLNSTFTIPSAIESLVIDNIATSSVSLSWATPLGNISSYIIQVLGTPSKELIVNTNSSLVDQLIPGNYYTFMVFATAGNMNGTKTLNSTNTVPSVIASLIIDNVTTSSVFVSWPTPVGNISSYIIQVLGTPSKELIVNTNSSLVDQLIPGNYYTFMVFATAGNMNGTKTLNSTNTVPSVIASLIIDNVTTSSVFVSWPTPVGNISSYIIQVLGTPSKELMVNTNFSLVDQLIPGNYYTFKVFDTVGNMNGTKIENSTFTFPSTIASLIIDNVTTSSVSLSWPIPLGNISSYIIQVLGTPSKELLVNTNSSLVDQLIPGNYYTFMVFATAGNMNGTNTMNSTFTVPSVIASLIIDNVTTSSVFLSWATPLGNISSYIIQVLGTPSKELMVNTNSSLVDQLIPGNYYTFTVFDTVGNMNGTKIENSTFTQPASIIVNNVLKLNETSLTVNWQLSGGNYSYFMAEAFINPPQMFNTTSYFFSFYSLPIGELHKIMIFAVAGNGIQGEKSTVLFLLSDTLNYTNVFADSIALAWMSPDDQNVSFIINITGSPSTSWEGSANQTVIEGLTPGNLYTIQLAAYQGSDMLYGFGSLLLLHTRPSVVSNIQVSNVSTYSVDLRWSPPTGQHDYYRIEVIGYVFQQMNTTVESISIQNLTPGTNYTFRIWAVVGDNILGDPNESSSFTKPANINILNINRISNSSLYVSWHLTEGSTTSYLVEVTGDLPQQFNVESESINISNLTTGNQYTVAISAVAGSQQGGKSEFSVLLSDTLSCTNISTNSMTLLWDTVSEPNISYTINVTGSPPWNWSNSTSEFMLQNLIPGNLYIIQLSAYQENNLLYGYGGQISVYTRPEEVKNVTFGNETISSIDVAWLPPIGNYSFYKVVINEVQNMTNSTTWTFQELTAGTQYRIQISAVAGEDVTGSAVLNWQYTRPDVIQNLSISSLNTTSVSLSWLKPQGGKNFYYIKIFGTDMIITSATESCTIPGLTPGSQYTLLVYAVAGDITGNPVNVTVTTNPSAIESLIIDNVTTTSVSLSWPIPLGNISSYIIQVVGTPSKELIVNTNSAVVDQLIPGNYYTFMVFATAGNMNGTKILNSTFTDPSAIESLIIDNVTTTSVSLSWPIPLGNISSYIIQVLGTPSKELIVNTNSSLVDQLIPGNYYTFMVFATAGNMNGTKILNSTFTAPSAITSLTIDNITTTSVSLSWPIPLGNISSYIIQVLGTPSNELIVNTNSSLVDQLIPGNYYTFMVFATAGNMNGTKTVNSTFTVPSAIASLIIDNVTTTSVSLSWSTPLGNISSYIIQVLGTPSKELIVNTNSSVVDQLIPGNDYTFTVFATAGNMNSTKTLNSTFTVPSAITSLTIDNITTTSVSLSWPIPLGNISSYIIQVLGTPSNELIVNTNSSLVDQLIPGNYYTFIVFATAGNMNGTKTVNSTFTVPSAIASLIMDNVTTTSVSLSWSTPLGNISSYIIQVLGTPSKELIVNTNSSVVDQLIPGNDYTFTVFATAGNMNSTKTLNSTFTDPSAIESLTIDNVTTASVSLSWAIPLGNISSYIIQVLGTPSKELIVNTNSAVVDQLIPGNYYTFMVFATAGNLNGTKTLISTFTAPSAITSLTIDNITTSSVSLSWPIPLGNISSYIIQVLGTPSNELIVNTNSSLVNQLIPGNYYTFIVFTTAGNMNGTKTVNSTFTVPSAIASLIIDNVTTTSVSLSWSTPLGNISSYIIQVLGTPSKELIVNTNSSVVDQLIPGNYYTFMVFATAGNLNGTKTLISPFTAPSVITSLTIDNITTSSVSLSWPIPLGNISSYIIQVLGTPSNELIVNTNSSLVDQLIPGNYYTFIVFATAGNMNGTKTVNSTFTVPSAIASLIIDNVTTTSVSLSWSSPIGNISSYIIQVLGTPSKELIVNTNSSVVDQLIPGNYYTFTVFATAGNMNSTKTLNSTFTVPSAIASLIIDNVTTTSVSLSWSTPLGNVSSYIIQVLGTPSKELIVNTNSSVVDQLIPGNYYTFTVFATAGNMNSTKTLNSTFTDPSAITSLIIDNITTTLVSLSWPIPLGNISSYIIQVLGTPSKELIVNTNSAVVDQLIPGNYYTFMVFATAGNLNGTKTLNSTFTAPSAITSLTIDNITTTSVSLSWPIPLGNISSYIIQVLGTPSNELIVNTNSSLVDQLIPGNYYTFMVFATAGNMNGTKTVNSTFTVPSAIASLIIDNVTTTSVSLSWSTPIGNISSYIIQVLGTPSKELIVNTNSSVVDQLIPGNYYTFTVFATAGNMNSTKTLNSTFTDPSAIESLIIDNVTTTSVSLSWPIPLGNISSYIIQVSGTPSKELIVNTNSAVVDQLIPGNYYTFMVFATDGNLNGTKTLNSTFTVPSAITSLNIDNITTTSVSLSWAIPLGNISSYIIQVLGTPSKELIANRNSSLVDQLIPENYYTFLVFATAGNMNGTKTMNSTFTVPSAIASLIIDNVTTSSVSLSWPVPLGNISSYIIQVLGTPSKELIANTNSSFVDQLIPGNYYTFMVFATAGSMNGMKTLNSTFIVPSLITSLIIDNVTTNSVSLSWPIPLGNISSYIIQVLGIPSKEFMVYTNSSLVDQLVPGNYYTFQVFGTAGSMNGTKILNSTFTVPPLITSLIIDNVTTNSVSLSWTTPLGNISSYIIQVLGTPSKELVVNTNSSLVDQLIPGNYYTFMVFATNGNINGTKAPNSTFTVPSVIPNLTIDNVTTNSVSLSWATPLGNVSSYIIQVLGTPSKELIVNTNSSLVDQLIPGNYYTFMVFATNGNMNSTKTQNSTSTVLPLIANLIMGNVATDSVSLSWPIPLGNISSFIIQVLGTPSKELIVNTNSLVVDHLIPGNYYTFVAFATNGNMSGTKTLNATFTVLPVIASLILDNVTTNSVSLSWATPLGNVSSYIIQVLGTPSKELIVNTNSSLVDQLIPGNYYTFMVSATNGNINGTKTSNSTFTVLPVIASLIINNITTNSVSLSWATPLGNISSYIIQVLGTPSKELIVNTNSSLVDQLIPGNYYTFMMFATNGKVNGTKTSISASTVLPAIASLIINNITTNSVSLSWASPLGNISSYIIQVLGTPPKELLVNTNSSLVDQLIPGNYYTFMVFATNGNINSTKTSISASTVLPVIASLILDNITTSSVSLNWATPLGNISSYIIQVLGTPSKELIVNRTSFFVDQLIPGNYYTFMVFVTNGNMNGTKTQNSTFTVPSVIASLIIYNVTTSSVSLSWPIPFGNISSYIIQVLGTPSKELMVNTNSSLVDQLIPGNYYTFMVFATAGNMNGTKTLNSSYIYPLAISSLIVYNVTTTSVSLRWPIPLGNISSYIIQVLEIPSKELIVNTNSSLVDQLVPGNKYTFTVFATVGNKNGTKIENSTFTEPGIINILNTDKISNNSLYVSWHLTEGNATSYLVEVIGDLPQKFYVQSESVNISNLTTGNQYTVAISAVAGSEQGSKYEFSVMLSDTLSCTNISTNSMTLLWDTLLEPNISYTINVIGSPPWNWSNSTNEIVLGNLIPGNLYIIQLSAYQGNTVLHGYGGQITVYTIPPVIANLIIDNVTTNSMSVSWAIPLGNFSSYIIQVLGTPSKELIMHTNSSLVDQLIPGNYYTFMVFSTNGNMNGTKTQISTFTVPSAVTSLSIDNVSTTSVFLSWPIPFGNVSSYIIQVSGTSSKELPPVYTNSLVVDQLIPGNYYTFTVFAIVGSMNSTKTINSTLTVPSAITSLFIDNVTSTSVSLSWPIPLGNISSYIIQVSGTPSRELPPVYTNSSVVDQLIPGNYYTFIVFAVVGNMNGTKTMNSTSTVPLGIASLSIYNVTTTSVSLNWPIPLRNISSYIIQVLGIPSKELPVNTNSLVVDQLIPGNYYTFVVFATAGNMNGTKSVNSTSTVPSVIANLIIDNITTTSVSLSWPTPLGNISSYIIQVSGIPSKELLPVYSNSSIVDQLIPGNYYTFTVFATAGNMNGTKTENSITTVPSAVANLNIDNVTTTSVSLSWPTPSGNISSYIIQVVGTPSKKFLVNTNSLVVDQLIPGNYYTFMVFATTGNMNGTKTVNSTSTVPSAITSLIIENVTTTSMSLSWPIPLGNISSYIIQVSGTPSKELPPVYTNSLVVDQLIPGNYYTFTVFATAGSMNGTTTVNSRSTVPSAIASLIIYNVATTSVSLSWSSSLGNISSYIIQVLGTPSKELIVNTNSLVVDQLIPGNFYTFTVFVKTGNMNGTKTVNSTSTVPSAIASLIIYNVTTTSVSLSWAIPFGNISSYIIQVLGSPTKELTVNTNLFVVPQLTPGNYYTFVVFATAGNMNGTKTMNFTSTVPSAITSLIIDNITTTSVSLSWPTPSGNISSYIIQVSGNSSNELIVNTNSSLVNQLIPGNYYTFTVFATAGNMNGTKTVNDITTDSNSLFLSMTYSTIDSNIQDKIIQQVQEFLSKTYPGQRITVTLKQMRKIS
ncbi:titin [Xenopus tropicalis]|uniref:Titin n=1 Tax=Xenopus tropicalis TaxID=8364 RepID=A0A8J1JMB5_XENTR|nr:titin [Xenopus tropicalis]